ncbi:glutamate receptor 3.3-like [Neltuma alba]|uniref:glutamate receptor 3.3-like n=1 Tax=Neltuma alba TaxID=207710 RepID=UPI0010A3AD7D|nr:glutamate receptor 3.3-like [Prosopis alba]
MAMVVKVRSDSKNGWILLTPFDRLLWLILAAIFVGATVIVILLEIKTKHDVESKFKHFVRNPFLIYMSDVEFLKSGASKWVVLAVTFLLSIAVQVYTANLTSILTERTTAKPSPWKDLQEIKRNSRLVGY